MNLFVTNNCPVESAKFLDDKRCVKMVLETAQILSTALRFHGFTGECYKISYLNHPTNIWTRTSSGNYLWVLTHFKALCDEYTLRYNKIHKSASLLTIFTENSHFIPEGDLTSFSNNARNLTKGVDYSHITDVPLAYRFYLLDRWSKDVRKPTRYGVTI
jgi:hypothetical protein